MGDVLRVTDPSGPWMWYNYTVIFNINEFDGHLVLPPIPPGNTFVVTRNLISMLTASALLVGMEWEDLHANMAKLRRVCKIVVGRPNLDMDVLVFRALWYH